MRITKITLDGFGLFEDSFEVELPDGVALIIGDNETGKSTIFSAIGAILFGLANEIEKAAFAPDGHASPRSGSLEIETGTGLHRFSRDFASNDTRVETLAPAPRVLFEGSAKPGGRSDEKEAYDAVMRDLLGVQGRDVFSASVMTEQSGLEPDMAGVIRRIVSGSSTADYAIALDKLKEAGEKLSRAMPWRARDARNDRKIEIVSHKLQEMKSALTEARGLARKAEESGSRLGALEIEVAGVDGDLRDKKARLDDLTSFTRALKEKGATEDRVNDHRKDIRQIEKLREELKGLSGKIDAEYSEYVALPDEAEIDIAGLAQLMENERDLDRRREQAEGVVAGFGLSRAEMIAVGAGMFAAVGGAFFFTGIIRSATVIVGVGALVVALARAYLALRSRQVIRQGKLDELNRQIGSLKSRIGEIQRSYPVLQGGGPSEILAKLGEFRQARRKKELAQAGLRQYEDLEKIESEYDRLGNELIVLNGRLDELRSKRPGLTDIEREGQIGRALEDVKAAIPTLENRRKELAIEREALIRALAAAEAKETISEEALEEDIADAESSLGRLKLSRDAHIMAVEALEEAVDEFRASHLSRIEQKTTDLLELITGRKREVKLNEKLEPLGLERDGRLLALEQLSQGVRDQLYFALRVAAVEEISGEDALPILLDDPFVNFDEIRLKATLDMLDKLSESRQTLLLTHDRRYGDWRKPAVVLER